MPNKIKKTQVETPEVSQGRDMFQTPNYATELLIPYIPKQVNFIWEPAVGFGKIADVLKSHKYTVSGSDISGDSYYWNFLLEEGSLFSLNDTCAIITNPPFSLKQKFYEKCRSFDIPFALLISFDMSQWLIKAFRNDNCQAIVPTRRINYITPTGLSQLNGHTANFHSFWLTYKFNLKDQMNFVDLYLNEMKNNV